MFSEFTLLRFEAQLRTVLPNFELNKSLYYSLVLKNENFEEWRSINSFNTGIRLVTQFRVKVVEQYTIVIVHRREVFTEWIYFRSFCYLWMELHHTTTTITSTTTRNKSCKSPQKTILYLTYNAKLWKTMFLCQKTPLRKCGYIKRINRDVLTNKNVRVLHAFIVSQT